MQPLTCAELLDVWEQGRLQNPLRQALILLEAACPEETPQTLSLLPIGARDARLLTLYAWTFGEVLHGVADCTCCKEPMEFDLPISTLLQAAPPESASTF